MVGLGIKAGAVLLLALCVGGCFADSADNAPTGSTSSRRSRNAEPDAPRQVCVDTLEGGSSKTVCY